MGFKLVLALILTNTIDAVFLQNLVKKIKSLMGKPGY